MPVNTQPDKTNQTIKSVSQPSPVTLATSKKLQALVAKSNLPNQQNTSKEKLNGQDIAPQLATELQKAERLIERRIVEIKSAYPGAMKNRLFNIQYGSAESYKTMPIQKAFKRLNIQTNQIDFGRVKEYNCVGEKITFAPKHKD